MKNEKQCYFLAGDWPAGKITASDRCQLEVGGAVRLAGLDRKEIRRRRLAIGPNAESPMVSCTSELAAHIVYFQSTPIGNSHYYELHS